ncbi:chromate efflux transporter [Aurantimonas sp. Leaf443]|uniref:chromate efflux transporter n=1 Tax=Aurantimonas sp. Leaf443 TaxID=1736378 RepID=UPI0006F9B557|nr:chromate efflux transporter [Aurantimonas sp. Leaf443]KQT82171.1 chromate transporter [Aurantimonas sp. Leaf443]
MPAARPMPTLREALPVWGRIAALSFGGPAGQIAVMHRILVDEKRWIGEARFSHALNVCMLLPGPEAQQLATYVGWLMHGRRGGLLAGGLFVLPGALAILALSLVYVLYGQLPLVSAALMGLQAAVLAIVVEALMRIGRRALKRRAHLVVAVLAFAALFLFGLPFPLVVAAAAVCGALAPAAFGARPAAGGRAEAQDTSLLGARVPDHARPNHARTLRQALAMIALFLAPILVLNLAFGPGDVFSTIARFFGTMAFVTFGGAYAVLAYVAQAAVQTYGWLSPTEMLDGLGLAETTPGPLIMVLQFVGFLAAARAETGLPPLVAGTLGAVLTIYVTFLPSFLLVFSAGPYVEALRANRALSAALSAITAAVVGVIANLSLWLALHVLFGEVRAFEAFGLHTSVPVLSSLDGGALLLAALAFVLLFRLHWPMGAVLAAGCAAGLARALLFG